MERRVKIRAFSYNVQDGKRTKRIRVVRGETHDFPDDAIEQGEALDAFFSDAGDTEGLESSEVLDFDTASVEDITEYIEEEHPNVNDLIEATGGSPEIAQKVLEAETAATGNDPRKTLVEGLTEVISRGSE